MSTVHVYNVAVYVFEMKGYARQGWATAVEIQSRCWFVVDYVSKACVGWDLFDYISVP